MSLFSTTSQRNKPQALNGYSTGQEVTEAGVDDEVMNLLNQIETLSLFLG